MSLLLALLAQVGPYPGIGDAPVTPLPREDQQREERNREKAERDRAATPITDQPTTAPTTAPAAPTQTKLGACLAMTAEDPQAAETAARDWLKQAKGAERTDAGQCLGAALVAQEDFANARTAFIAARDAAGPAAHGSRARLGAMAGNAALAEKDPAGALALLDMARADAGAANDLKLASGIATDRARALVLLKRDGEALSALDDARSSDPTNAEAWLLSATLSRRMGRLATAQAQIEEAARLQPTNPEIGLEAGVIAVLAGHDEAARKSWQSVLKMAPNSDAAATAKSYLAQLDTPHASEAGK